MLKSNYYQPINRRKAKGYLSNFPVYLTITRLIFIGIFVHEDLCRSGLISVGSKTLEKHDWWGRERSRPSR
jgi:hypothetical protein